MVGIVVSRFLGVELDCATFSLARRGKPGSSMPQRLRSKRYPWGLPHLSPGDRCLVRRANFRTRAAFSMIQQSVRRGASGYLENPLGSILWHLVRRVFKRELDSGLARFVSTDLCCYGTDFLKPTRVMIWARIRKLSSSRVARW